MQARIVVRPVKPEELPSAARLLEQAGLPLAGLEQVTTMLGAFRADALVATAALEMHGTDADKAYLLRSVAVAPSEQRQGVARSMVDEVLGSIGPSQTVGLLTETASSYFERLGFTRVAWSDLPEALQASAELNGGCARSAQAMLMTTSLVSPIAPERRPPS